MPEPGSFPGLVTRSSCVWLQTEAGAGARRSCLCACGCSGNSGPAEELPKNHRRPRPSPRHAGQPSLPAGRAGRGGWRCSVPLGAAQHNQTRRGGRQCGGGFIAEPGYSAGLQHPLVRASPRQREATGVEVGGRCQQPGNTKLSRGCARSIPAAPALTAPQGLSILQHQASGKAGHPRG